MTEYQTVPVYTDRYVPLPAYLTQPVDQIERPDVVDTVALGATLKACMIRLDVANGQLAEIAKIHEEE